MSVELEELNDDPRKPDFRRANGAPMVTVDGKNERYSRPSGWGKMLDDENALVNWKIDTAIRGVAEHPDIAARAAAVKPDDRRAKAELRESAIQAGRGSESADLGTALHAMTERWEDPADSFEPPEPYRTSLKAYSAEMARLGLTSERIEYTVANREYRSAGTCDRLYRLTKDLETPDGKVLPAGTLIIGDVKTGKKLDFSLPGYHVQMALYALGEFYDVEQDCFMPTPEINVDWGLLVWMPASGDDAGICKILWCDLQVGNYGAYLVNEIKDWRRKWNNGTYASPEVGEPTTVATPSDDAWCEDMVKFIRNRMTALREQAGPEGVQKLSMAWPVGAPPPKKLSEPNDIRRVLKALDKIEADLGLEWPEKDPRSEPGAHKSAGPVSNDPPGVVEEEGTS